MVLTTEETIRKTVDFGWGRFSTYRNNVMVGQQLYRNEFTPRVPPSISEPIKLADAARIVDEIADHVLIRYIMVHARPNSASDVIRAEKRSKFLSGFWHTVYQQSQWNPVREAVKNFPISGASALKVVPDVLGYEEMMDRADEEPEQDEGEDDERYERRASRYKARRRSMAEYFFPFFVTAPNPLWLAWDLSPRRPEWVIEQHARRGDDILDEFPELEDRVNIDNTYNCTEFWDEDTFAYLINGGDSERGQHNNGTFAIHRRNKHGIPYAIKFAGTGSVDDQFLPENIGRGLLFRERQAIIENSTTYNQLITITRRLAWPNFVTDKKELRQVVPGYGNVVLLDNITGDLVKRLDEGTIDPAMFNLVELQGLKLDRETTPSVLRGIRQPGTSSAAEAAIHNENVRMLLEATILATMGLIELSNITVLRSVDECFSDTGVRVYGTSPYGWDYDQKVTGADINGAYANAVTLAAGPNEDRGRLVMESAQLVQMGVRDLETHFRFGENAQDPQQRMAALLTDKALFGDEIVALVSKAIAQLTEIYLLEKGLNMAQRSLAAAPAAGEPTLISGNPPGGAREFNSPSSFEGQQRQNSEFENAMAGTSEGMARYVG